MNNLYYDNFNLTEPQNKLIQYCQEKDIDAVACENHFIFSKELVSKKELIIIENKQYFRLNQGDCKFANVDLLAKHGFSIGSYAELTRPAYVNQRYYLYLLEFKNLIIDLKISWATEFLKKIYSFLKNRNSGKECVINKEFIQFMISDVVIHIESAEQYRNYSNNLNFENISGYQTMAIKELKVATQILAKLYGGRAFLSGNIIEMMMIFEYFRDIYFE